MRVTILILMLCLQQTLTERVDTYAAPLAERQGGANDKGFDEAKWRKIVGDTDYTERERDAGFQMPSMPWAGPLIKIVSYVLIIGLVVWIFYYLMTNIGFGAGIQRTAIEDEDVASRVENIESLDIDALLIQAMQARNFRLAIRLYYLGILQKLHGLGAIVWKRDKTNRDYLSELYARNLYYGEMRRLTVLYEAVWYGEHTPGTESFERLTAQFESMYRKIDTVTTP